MNRIRRRPGGPAAICLCVIIAVSCTGRVKPPVAMRADVRPLDSVFTRSQSVRLPGVKADDVTDVAVGSSGNAYVIDGRQRQVFEYSPDGALALRIGGPGRSPGQFFVPWRVIEAAGHVFVLDIKQSRLHIFDQAGRFNRAIAFGSAGITAQDVLVDSSGTIFVGGYRHSTPSDHTRFTVHRLQEDGDIVRSFYPLDTRVDALNLKVIAGVALAPGPDGTLYAGQVTSSQVMQFDSNGGIHSVIEGDSRVYRAPVQFPIIPSKAEQAAMLKYLSEWSQLVTILPGPDNMLSVVFSVHNPVKYAVNVYKNGRLVSEGLGTDYRPVAWTPNGALMLTERRGDELWLHTYQWDGRSVLTH